MGGLLCASLIVASAARADPPEEERPPADLHEPAGVTIPVRIEAGSDALSIDDVRCRHGSCEGRFAPGRHTVRREVLKDGDYVTESTQDIDLREPSVVAVDGPGFLRKTATVTLVAGAVIVLAGVILPLVLCSSRTVTDPTTRLLRTDDPCERVSDGVKVAWIGGVGVGLTLVTLGLIGYATTSGASRVTTRRWALVPSIAPVRVEGRITPAAGLGVVFAF